MSDELISDVGGPTAEKYKTLSTFLTKPNALSIATLEAPPFE